MPNLGSLENMALFLLQAPGTNFTTGVPNWSTLTNPQFGQAVIDYYLNEGYRALLRDTADFAPAVVSQTFPSGASTYQYAIPYAGATIATSIAASTAAGTQTVTPASMTNIVLGLSLEIDSANPSLTEVVLVTAVTSTTFTATFSNAHSGGALVANVVMPAISKIQRVFYSPQGQNYTREYIRGQQLVSWDKFQHLYTGQGYLQKYGFATIPVACAISPSRSTLQFYPGSASAGDAITITYTPMLTTGAYTCAPLANASDTPIFPDDYHEAILQYAMSHLWIRARDNAQAQQATQTYNTLVAELRTAHLQASAGDTFGFQAFAPALSFGNDSGFF